MSADPCFKRGNKMYNCFKNCTLMSTSILENATCIAHDNSCRFLSAKANVRSDCLWHDCKAIFSYSFHYLPFYFINQSILQRHMLITCWLMVNLLSALKQEKYNNFWLQLVNYLNLFFRPGAHTCIKCNLIIV